MKRGLSILIGTFVFLLMVSCKGDDDLKSDFIMPYESNATALTATINSGFNGLSMEDLAYGTFGVLYCVANENAESAFNSWKNGNDKPDCLVFKSGSISSDGLYKAVIKGLLSDTEYNYCIFFISEDKSRREIGTVSSFRTKIFNPNPQSYSVEEVKHYTASITGCVTLAVEDLKLCTIGIILADTGEITPQGGKMMVVNQDDILQDGSFSMPVSNLRAGHEYKYRIFTKINSTEEFTLGPVCSFTSASPDDMAVDLGLSVKWADRDLGTDNMDERAPCYAWGQLVSYGTYFNLEEGNKYKYWNPADGSYIDIGDDISGTEYDVATYLLGGKWRMPTKAEVEELLTCALEIQWGGGGRLDGFKFTGSTGNSIYLTKDLRWTSTLSDYIPQQPPYDCKYANPWVFISYDGNDFFGDFNKQYYRFRECIIRPVCDF